MQNFCRAMLLVAPSVFFFHVQAQSTSAYPTKSVRVIASVLPGDTCDVLVRLVGYKMSERLGQQFVIDNRAGASGQIGHAMVAQASADGYTLGCGNGGSMAIVPHAFKKVPYDSLKDFTPIAMMATNFMGLAVSNAFPARNVGELIQHAKANPGKVSFGSNGEGAFLHFATEMFRYQAGFTYLHVPFKGLPQLAGEVISGRLDASFGSFSALHPYVQSGRMRLLGIAHSIVTLLNREANWAMTQPDFRDKMIASGLDIITESPEHFANFIRSDYARYGKIAKEIGLKAQ